MVYGETQRSASFVMAVEQLALVGSVMVGTTWLLVRFRMGEW
jgi:hypothetical protein